ncbi:hypothetical protein RB195_023589 [Necator americanus]|uniref:Uncharacterized protein n=1 Tax=Necator americanus TaxID=51031 RepID=A0ABR1EJT1_NECAM
MTHLGTPQRDHAAPARIMNSGHGNCIVQHEYSKASSAPQTLRSASGLQNKTEGRVSQCAATPSPTQARADWIGSGVRFSSISHNWI